MNYTRKQPTNLQKKNQNKQQTVDGMKAEVIIPNL